MTTRGELEVGLCRLRTRAYGLRACEDCPIPCQAQRHNLDALKRVTAGMEKVAEQLGL